MHSLKESLKGNNAVVRYSFKHAKDIDITVCVMCMMFITVGVCHRILFEPRRSLIRCQTVLLGREGLGGTMFL